MSDKKIPARLNILEQRLDNFPARFLIKVYHYIAAKNSIKLSFHRKRFGH